MNEHKVGEDWDLLEELGVVIDFQEKKPKKAAPVAKGTSNWNLTAEFRVTGRVARVMEHACGCGRSTRLLEGVFEEQMNVFGSRKMVPLRPGAPHGGGEGGWKEEIEVVKVFVCLGCLGEGEEGK